MLLRIDPASSVPPFEQLRVQIIALINDGSLVTGTRLPTVRALAVELSLAPNTVARAYRELETADFLQTRGRRGTFVAAGADSSRREAVQAARDYAERMRSLGISNEKAISYAIAALDG